MALSPARAGAVAAVVVLLGGGALTLPRVMAGLPPVGADAPAYCRIARTLVGTGSLELPGPDRIDRDVQQDVASELGTPYALTRDGRLFPKHSALFGILLAPGTAIGGTVGAQVSYLLLAAFELAARGYGVRAGLVGTLALFLRPTAALLVLPLPFVAAARGRGPVVRTVLGLGGGLLLFGAVNAWLWGGPFLTAYGRAAVFGPDGIRVIDHAGAFGTNPLAGVAKLVASYPHGLLFVFPLLLLSPLGFFLGEARRAEWWVPMVCGLASFLILGAYDYAVAHPDDMIYRFAGPVWFASAFPLAALLAWIRREGARLRAGSP